MKFISPTYFNLSIIVIKMAKIIRLFCSLVGALCGIGLTYTVGRILLNMDLVLMIILGFYITVAGERIGSLFGYLLE